MIHLSPVCSAYNFLTMGKLFMIVFIEKVTIELISV